MGVGQIIHVQHTDATQRDRSYQKEQVLHGFVVIRHLHIQKKLF